MNRALERRIPYASNREESASEVSSSDVESCCQDKKRARKNFHLSDSVGLHVMLKQGGYVNTMSK